MYDSFMKNVGIIGASGFTGAELMRLCAGHPDLTVTVAAADSMAGTSVADLYPSLAAHYGTMTYAPTDPALFADCDVVFLGLPHGASQALVPQLRSLKIPLIDLGADYRLTDPALYPQWYGEAHANPELLAQAVYGLPELFRESLKDADLIAVPGCFPTSASLALAPFVKAGLIETTGIIVDAATGVSGAGRAAKDNTTFCAVDEDFTAYALEGHRHTPEMEQVLATGTDQEVSVLFTPHLAPMNRGILATCYARPSKDLDTATALAVLTNHYAKEPFMVVSERSPSTKNTLGSNAAHLTARVDPRTGLLVSICALDNLGKGASGAALQCANLALGFEETLGLTSIGLTP